MELIETNKENSNFQPNTAATYGNYLDSAKLSESQLAEGVFEGRHSMSPTNNSSKKKLDSQKWKPKMKVCLNKHQASQSNSKGSSDE